MNGDEIWAVYNGEEPEAEVRINEPDGSVYTETEERARVSGERECASANMENIHYLTAFAAFSLMLTNFSFFFSFFHFS